MLRKGDIPVAGYKLVEFLGRGQYGEVWEATAPGGTEVALKFISLLSNAGAIEMKALRAVKLIRHPNLISMNAIWLLDEEGNVLDDTELHSDTVSNSIDTVSPKETLQPDDLPNPGNTASASKPAMLVIAMAKADKSLEDRLEEAVNKEGHQGIPIEELLDYIDQAATGLDFLNEERHLIDGQKRSVVHRDVKPANLLLIGTAVVVGDFGVATTLRDFDAMATSLSGSIGFMSPESISRKPSASTDQYALAISYYWMRTNTLPYAETISMDKLLEIHRTGALNFDFVEEDERKVLKKATSSDAANRFPSCRAFANALKELHFGGAVASEPVSNAKWIWGISSLATMLLLAVGFMIWGPGKTGDNPENIVPMRTLKFRPESSEFSISYLLEDEPHEVGRISGDAEVRVPEGGSLTVSSLGNSALWIPIDKKEFSYEELEASGWNISLEAKPFGTIRDELFQLLSKKMTSEANQLIDEVSSVYPNILALGDRFLTHDVTGNPGVLKPVVVGDSSIALVTQDQSNFLPQLITVRDDKIELVQGSTATGFVERLFFDPGTKQLIICQEDTVEARSIDQTRFGQTMKLKPGTMPIKILTQGSINRGKGLLAIGDLDGLLRIWKTANLTSSPQEISGVHGNADGIRRLIFGERNLLSISVDGSLALIDCSGEVASDKPRTIELSSKTSEEEFTETARSGPSGVVIATGSSLHYCESIDSGNPTFVKMDERTNDEVETMKGSEDGKWLLVSTYDSGSAFELWDLRTRTRVRSQRVKTGAGISKPTVTDFCFSPDSKWGCVVFNNGALSIIDLQSAEKSKQVVEFAASEIGHRKFAQFTSDSKCLFTFESRNEAKPRIEAYRFPESFYLIQAARSRN